MFCRLSRSSWFCYCLSGNFEVRVFMPIVLLFCLPMFSRTPTRISLSLVNLVDYIVNKFLFDKKQTLYCAAGKLIGL